MPVLAICPFCNKTITIERTLRSTCPECGHEISYPDLQRRKMIVDGATEKRELAAAKDYFVNTEFLSASEHFKKALAANKNSYSAIYFVSLCDIYLNESGDGYDLMAKVVDMIKSSLELMPRANASAVDKLKFITAMLAETKILIINRLTSRGELFENNISEYRKITLSDLKKLLELYKIDGELMMTFAPEVTKILLEIAESAVTACYKAVQTVAVGEDLYSPTPEEYKQLSSLCNDYCYFAQILDPNFDTKKFSPDFTQNNMLNEKVLSRFEKFDESNKVNAKKGIIGDIDEYENILSECVKALTFTASNCYKSMCSRQSEQHIHLLLDGLQLLSRLLMPRVTITDKKKVDIRVGKFVDIVDWCETLTKFLVDLNEFNEYADAFLEDFYSRLLECVETHFIAENNKYGKIANKRKDLSEDDFKRYEKLLYTGACCCVPALATYVEFFKYKDKNRNKLVKICKQASEEFLMLHDFKIDELEQNNFYRPILDIYNAVLEEMPD